MNYKSLRMKGNRTGRWKTALAGLGAGLVALLIVSCGDEDKSDVTEVWKAANEQIFSEISRNSEYTELPSPGNNGSIYYKVLKKGEGTKQIYFTSTVQIYYKSWFTVSNSDLNISKGDVFQQKLFDDGTPVAVAVNGYLTDYTVLTEARSIALQHMVEGDKWEVWAPCMLAFRDADCYTYYLIDTDASKSVRIPAYSTVVFEIEVVKVSQ